MLDWNKRWPNFVPEEVLSSDGLKQFKRGNLMIQPTALDKVQILRIKLDTPILINFGVHTLRAFRSIDENNSLSNPRRFSRHLQGLAFDITAIHLTFRELLKAVYEGDWGGIGIYEDWDFIHVDDRPRLGENPIVWGEGNWKELSTDVNNL